MEFRELREAELPAWYDHCQGVFQDTEAGYFKRHFELDPHADPSMVFVAMDGDVIAATLRVFRREVWIHGRAVKMGGIGEVSTKPAYRRQGLAASLLEMAIAAMAAGGMPISILYGDQPIYERAGWRFCDMPYAQVEAASLQALPEGMQIRPFEADDLPAIMGLYDLFAGRLDGAVVRSEAYWRSWVMMQWTPPQVLLSDGRPVAYACTRLDEDDATRLRAEEFAIAPHAMGWLGGFLHTLAERAARAQVSFASPLYPDAPGAVPVQLDRMMVRLNSPLEDWRTSDDLVTGMRNAGMFPVDHF